MIKRQFHDDWLLRKDGEPAGMACPVILPHDAMIHEKRQANNLYGETRIQAE